jgi:putative FmdB family regulatory protein
MPVYEYRCEACEEQFELMRKFSDPKLDECPRCGKGPVEKLISRSSFALKGSGWYKSGYASASAPCSKSDSKPACAGCPSASPSSD